MVENSIYRQEQRDLVRLGKKQAESVDQKPLTQLAALESVEEPMSAAFLKI
ncbi:hypothetical protein [Calothrix sp. UHCC 0171]|uniref:hypothetical protein n=1 Tax=Calothrix sp. UHCC 0171 TaxID=3110245 RepID=UPI002B20BA8E|nr:hypothetical protein [Calothrix sp. UHCC 0171]MEA5574039.1 hypothetical protein [Calothrix sp. UHCC 0171]